VKERFEDYEQMLQYYTLMRTKNNMKDSNAKSKEWWEVAKELEKNLAQHRVDERNLMYKLEIYQKKFQSLFVGVQQVQRHQAKMKRLKQGPIGQLKRRKYRLTNHMNSKEGARTRKNHRQLKNKNKWRLLQQQR